MLRISTDYFANLFPVSFVILVDKTLAYAIVRVSRWFGFQLNKGHFAHFQTLPRSALVDGESNLIRGHRKPGHGRE